jgi:hypothetical protein
MKMGRKQRKDGTCRPRYDDRVRGPSERNEYQTPVQMLGALDCRFPNPPKL